MRHARGFITTWTAPRFSLFKHTAVEARLIALTCGAAPDGRARWSLRLLTDRVVALGHVKAVSHETVRQALKAGQRHRTKRPSWTERASAVMSACSGRSRSSGGTMARTRRTASSTP